MKGIGIEDKVIPREELVDLIREWIKWYPAKKSWVNILLEECDYWRGHYESAMIMWNQSMGDCAALKNAIEEQKQANWVLANTLHKTANPAGDKSKFVIKKKKKGR